jgi:hypothetical protein
MNMSPETAKAISGCFTTRGKYKGKLLAKCPPLRTPEAAAWQAMALAWNPYKAGLCAILFMPEEFRPIYREALDWAESNMQLRGLDRDRLALETMGAW